MVDGHAHLAADELFKPGDLESAQTRARESLRAGVTLLLDKGWSDTTSLEVKASVPAGERPEIEAAARVLAVAGGYYPEFAEEIDPALIEEAVAVEARAGAGWVKLIGDWPRRGEGPRGNFTLDELRRAVNVAEDLGCKVAIHTMAREVPSMAVAAGIHSIEHGLFLTESDIGALGSRGGMWVPTVLRVEATLTQLGPDSTGGRLMRAGLDNVSRLLPLAVEAGVHVLAGTDLVGSPTNIGAEALRLAELGLGTELALRAVGISGFEVTGRSVAFDPGSPADAVFFADDPTRDLGVLAHPSVVVRLGRVL